MTRLDSPDTCDNDMDQKSSVYSAHNDPMRDMYKGGGKSIVLSLTRAYF